MLGPIAGAIGSRATFVACAILVVGATVPVLFSRDVRTLERRIPQVEQEAVAVAG